jgi:protein-S-isoprenylcysteine O-methyltransferase Ste14
LVPNTVRVPLGLVLVSVAGYFSWAGLRTVYGGPGEPQVIREGVYAWVRHPIYLGEALLGLGFLAFGHSLAALAVWIGWIVFLDHIARYEEGLLLARFGDDYARYMRQVPRWLPWPWPREALEP